MLYALEESLSGDYFYRQIEAMLSQTFEPSVNELKVFAFEATSLLALTATLGLYAYTFCTISRLARYAHMFFQHPTGHHLGA